KEVCGVLQERRRRRVVAPLRSHGSRVVSKRPQARLFDGDAEMNSRRAAFTWIEALVCLAVLVALCILLTPAIPDESIRGSLTAPLNNPRQFQLATMAMTEETMNSGKGLEWTTVGELGDKPPRPATFAEYRDALVKGGFINRNELKKLLTAPGIG